MSLKIGLPIPGKLREGFKKDKGRRINIKGLDKISERTLRNQHWFKSAWCLPQDASVQRSTARARPALPLALLKGEAGVPPLDSSLNQF